MTLVLRYLGMSCSPAEQLFWLTSSGVDCPGVSMGSSLLLFQPGSHGVRSTECVSPFLPAAHLVSEENCKCSFYTPLIQDVVR
jgi:hypothetical protein